MKLVSVYKMHGAEETLYGWLRERSEEDDPYINISHRKLPSWREHLRFFNSSPFRYWFFIVVDHRLVGYVSASWQNEIGIVLNKTERGKGYGPMAVSLLLKTKKPLSAIPGKRSGGWIANINPKNARSIGMFESLGFKHIQNTYECTS